MQKHTAVPAMIFTLIVGTLLHFTYGLLGEGAAWFSAVNESTWEHLKLLFFPVMAAAPAEYAAYGRRIPAFLFSTWVGVLAGMAFIVVFFYTYTGILGYDVPALSVGSFFVSVFITYSVRQKTAERKRRAAPVYTAVGLAGMLILAALFIRFTYAPPAIGLFRDPLTGRFGRL